MTAYRQGLARGYIEGLEAAARWHEEQANKYTSGQDSLHRRQAREIRKLAETTEPAFRLREYERAVINNARCLNFRALANIIGKDPDQTDLYLRSMENSMQALRSIEPEIGKVS